MRRYGAYEDEPTSPEAPRPASGHSQDGRDALKQVLLSLGVSGDGGLPLRVGRRAGHRSERVETPLAIVECLALGWDGVRGMVAESTASSRRPRGLGLAQGLGLVTFGPRTRAVREALAAWGQQPPALPLCVEQPGRTPAAAPRRWPGPSVPRHVEVADSAGRVAAEVLRCVVVPARQLAPQHAQAEAAAQARASEAVAAHGRQGHAPWFACRPEAEAAIAA